MDEIICIKLGDFEENCYFFSYNDRLCVVDPGCYCSSLIHEIDCLCEKYNLTFDAVFLTHGHLDHVAALPKIKDIYPDIKVYINERDKDHLGKDSYKFQYNDFSLSGMGWFVEKMLEDGNDLPEADYFVRDGNIIFGDWKVISTPGHTRGSCCLYNEKLGILFTGDTLMFYSCGRTDLIGGSDIEMNKSLELLSAMPKDTVVCPGHEMYGFKLGQSSVLTQFWK